MLITATVITAMTAALDAFDATLQRSRSLVPLPYQYPCVVNVTFRICHHIVAALVSVVLSACLSLHLHYLRLVYICYRHSTTF